jgi:hypothetical protein
MVAIQPATTPRMRFEAGHILHSPSDLANFAACRHLTTLDRRAMQEMKLRT